MVSPTVVLQVAAALWDCDCRSVEDPCEHVTAAVIALRRARERGDETVVGERGGLAYRLERRPEGLHFERVVKGTDQDVPLRSTLAAVASGRVDGPSFAAGEADIEVERALGSTLRGTLRGPPLRRLLGPLSRCTEVTLDGQAVTTDAEPVLPVAIVEDCAEGFRVVLAPDPSVDETLSDGIVLCGNRVRPLGSPGLTGRELEDYSRGLVIPLDDAAQLVTEILPHLSQLLPVDVKSERLPQTTRETPRLVVRVERDGDRLTALPTLVYGNPPRARIDAGRLVHLSGDVPLRDRAREDRLLRYLRQGLGLVPGHRLVAEGEDALALAEQLESFGGEIEGDEHRDFYRTGPLVPHLDASGDRFELRFEIEPERAGATPRGLSAEGVIGAWRRGEALVELDGGGFAPLPSDWLERFGDQAANLLRERLADGQVPACLLPDLAAVCEGSQVSAPPGFERLRVLVESFDALPRADLPQGLRAELRSYQRRGIDWLAFHREAELGALLADDMGLGKTLQALCALRGRTLVVCPTSVLVSWREQIDRFRPGMRVCLYHGPRRKLEDDAELTLTTYALLRVDEEILTAPTWDTLVLDEAQAIKNATSQVARAAYRLRGRFRIVLTGTPVENRLEELWSHFQFLNRGLLGPQNEFAERVAKPIAAGDTDALAGLRQRIRPFLLRRLKSEVARELPPRTEVVLHCELSEEERAVYDAIRAATRQSVVERLGSGGSVLAALEALLRLRQACCHSALVPGQRAESSAKVRLLLEELECAVAEGHRALVFSQWTGLLDLVEPHLKQAGIDFDRLDGSTRDRAGVVERFQDPEGPPVLLISLRAGGTGLNLTAADHVFLLDPWWNPAVEDQAADRAHRIGQTRPVIVHRLVARDSVEERMLALQRSKRELGDAALGGIGTTGSISREDLLALLE
jgi:superfamily II DNA or RNA helicase